MSAGREVQRWRRRSFLNVISAVGGSLVVLQQLVLIGRVTCPSDLPHHAISMSHLPQQTSSPDKSTPTTTIESFVISFDPLVNISGFNEEDSSYPLSVFPALDGYHQRNLNLWAKLIDKYPPLYATNFTNSPQDRGKPASPKAVGCYMSHWNLLRSLSQRPASLRPAAFMVLEDDASCAPGLMQHIQKTLSVLPADWDFLFVGGKPFSYFDDKVTMNKTYLSPRLDVSRHTLRRDICLGDLGRARGPLAPDGSRVLNPDTQAYWKVHYMTNTDAYVVNPARLADKILPLLKPKTYVPIDIRLGELMDQRKLNVYMTTHRWCKQVASTKEHFLSPTHWPGFFGIWQYGTFPNLTALHPGLEAHVNGHVWQTQLYMENCTY